MRVEDFGGFYQAIGEGFEETRHDERDDDNREDSQAARLRDLSPIFERFGHRPES